jgi:proteasome lid subunit RPN8/RPN11
MGLATDFWTQVEDSADARGLQIVGFYHSHPDHPAQPSLYDLEHAWVNMAYIIVSVQAGKLDHIRNWQLKPDRSAFEEITLTAVE